MNQFLVTLLPAAASFNALWLWQQSSAEPASSGIAIFLVPLLLALAVVVVVGLPFYINYRKEVKPKENVDKKV